MHESYDDEDDNYDDEYYDNDYGDQYDPYKFYFKFDVDNSSISDWIQKIINDVLKNPYDLNSIPGFPFVSFPVNSYFSNTEDNKTSLYLGNNYANEPIWKNKYFIHNKLETEYVLHLQSHTRYVVSQPRYYKSLYEILN